ncbi:MAG: AAA family ATPase [Actinobacteria bacterium]|uniref:Unannotated protein n=1 Tax=freshwater metagenome TaxID=449393 RepID=A0A6J6VQV7_9ZZZZ|nr:AAA family ATPase [Actinomycetota bacterium]
MSLISQDSDDFHQEQVAYDTACEEREKFRRSPFVSAGANRDADSWLYNEHKETRSGLQPPSSPVFFGSRDDASGRLHVGYDGIRNDAYDVLVVSWKAPAAEAFYGATAKDSRGLISKRDYDVAAHRISSIEETNFADLLEEIKALDATPMDSGQATNQDRVNNSDGLLAALARGRTGEMHDIVKTIQAAQSGIIRSPHNQMIAVQGGPGTGKTGVALHRISWLLYNVRDLNPTDVLVVGPSKIFIRYISGVLPSLGDPVGPGGVAQISVSEAAGIASSGAVDAPNLAKLKGEGRLMGLLDRALDARVVIEDSYTLKAEGRYAVSITSQIVVNSLSSSSEKSWKARRESLHSAIYQFSKIEFAKLKSFSKERAAATGALPGKEKIDDRLYGVEIREADVDILVSKIFASLTPTALLAELFGSQDALARAGGGDFSEAELESLHRSLPKGGAGQIWSDADVALLDYLHERIYGRANKRTYKYIVVDEAQDLSPMQLRMIGSKSSNGHFTVLGDLAQSAGTEKITPWAQIMDHLAVGSNWSESIERREESLLIGYRVPRQLFEFAAQLLKVAAPGIEVPRAIREGTSNPVITVSTPSDICDTAAKAVATYVDKGLWVGVITPAPLLEEVGAALTDNEVEWGYPEDQTDHSVIVLAPQSAKGLEFDATVVIEPADIAADPNQGPRGLYVCLTRSTQHLTVVHSKAYLPLGLPELQKQSQPELPITPSGSPDFPLILDDILETASGNLAEFIKATLAPDVWGAVLSRVSELLAPEESGDS